MSIETKHVSHCAGRRSSHRVLTMYNAVYTKTIEACQIEQSHTMVN